jgi:large subunit ribosomal protein L4
MKVDIYNQQGEKTEKLNLNEKFFNLPWNEDLVHQVAVSMRANRRIPAAHAKGRGEVRGGGKKPWRQKGTGRARHGSIRSPIWIGGGVTHGPIKEKSYKKKINKKMRQKALFVVFSQKLRDKEVLFLDKLSIQEAKTKKAFEIIGNLRKIKEFVKLGKKNGRVLIFLHQPKKELILSLRNLPYVNIKEARNMNALDLLSNKFIVVTKGSLQELKTNIG